MKSREMSAKAPFLRARSGLLTTPSSKPVAQFSGPGFGGSSDRLRTKAIAGHNCALRSQVVVNMALPLAVLPAGTSSCITSQCSTTLPPSTRKISTATIGFGPQPV